MGVPGGVPRMYILVILTTLLMIMFFSDDIIVFPLCTVDCGKRVIKFVFVFVHINWADILSLMLLVTNLIQNDAKKHT